jgi:hypothetical protein
MLPPDRVRAIWGPNCPYTDDQIALLSEQLSVVADLVIDEFSDSPKQKLGHGSVNLRLLPPERLEDVEERAAIMEFEGKMPRARAERSALVQVLREVSP